MKMRLDRWLATLAVGSRNEVRTLIRGGKVSVNGEVCLMRGKKLYPGDRVEARGELYEVVSD